MFRENRLNKIILILDLLFLCYAMAAVDHLVHKAGLPAECALFELLVINGTTVSTSDESEFLISSHQIGDMVQIAHSPGEIPITVRLVPYYSTSFVIFDAVIALLLFVLAIMVHVVRPTDHAATLFHLSAVVTAAALIGVKTIYAFTPVWLGVMLCVLFFVAYTMVAALVVHFTFVFPSIRWPQYRRLMPWIYTAALIVASWAAIDYLQAASVHSAELFRKSMKIAMIENGFVLALLIVGITNLSVSYGKTSIIAERKKIRWVLYGLTIGPAPFLLLWVLPGALGLSPWTPEWLFKAFLLLIPVTFAVSILKYRIMDVDLLVNRSAVYGIVVGAGVAVYVGILFLATNLMVSLTRGASIAVATLSAVLLALLFDPARRKVQRIVDRKFFRVLYDFREAQRQFVEGLKQCLDLHQIAELLVHRTDAIVPVERIGFFTLRQPGNRIQLINHKGFDLLAARGIRFEAEHLKSKLNLPVALNENIEPSIEYESGDAEMFRRWGIALIFPMLSERGEIVGFLVLGKKKSGARFTAEDIDLLNTVSTHAGLAIERVILQEKLVLEHAETQRLEELSQLKSYFVSSVSHDLKTPLTSIRLFAELIRTKPNLKKQDVEEYLGIIEGESERLTRLINNVLDFAKIERGVKEYNFVETELNEIVEHTLNSLRYQFRLDHFTVTTALCDGIVTLRADRDALTEALINLLTNAMKYSLGRKEIVVSTAVNDRLASVRVADKGIGIAAVDIPHLFEPFFRAKEGKIHGAGGAGLGLALVKHIVDAHGGRIEVESTPGAGSTFTLFFPLEG